MDVAARREARRRRILENSESRLKKISSVHHGHAEDIPKPSFNSAELMTNNYNFSSVPADISNDVTDETKSDTLLTQDITRPSLNLLELTNNYNFSSIPPNISDDEIEETESDTFLQVGKTKIRSENVIVNRKWVISNSRTLIIILPILTNILCALVTYLDLSDSTYMPFTLMNKIFVPFLLYKLVDLTMNDHHTNVNFLLNTVLLLGNIPPRLSQLLIKISKIFVIIFQDLFLYFFVFLMAEVCLNACMHN